MPALSTGLKRTLILASGLGLALIAVAGILLLTNGAGRQDRSAAALVRSHHQSIHRTLMDWASRHDGKFPDLPGGAEANFTAGLPAGGISKSALLASPPGYATAYIAGLDASAESQTPLLVTARPHTLAFLTGKTKTPPLQQERGFVCITRVDGGAVVTDDGALQPLTAGALDLAPGQVRFSESFSNWREN